jgi:hypothetical protein
MSDELKASISPWRLREEADKRRELEARCAQLEREYQAFRITIVALGADPQEILATIR